MRAMQVSGPGKPLELVEVPTPEPGPGEVRIRVRACGICHSDMFTVAGGWPGVAYPRAPGHEIAGVVDAVGAGVTAWRSGARAGVGWHGGHDGTCPSCLRGDFVTCRKLRTPGLSYDGGYSECVIAPANVLAPIPEALSFEEAAPLMCAGVTTYNALRHSGARAGDLVAVLGVGGLGHLGVQFAAKMGFETIAIARGEEKRALALELGAVDYIDSKAENVTAKLNARGGARVVLSTVTSSSAMSPVIGGLAIDGRLVIVGASPEPLPVNTIGLLGGRRSIHGWPSGTGADSADALAFSALSGVRPMIETMPLERANEGYERMMSGQARFRVVLTIPT
jgi:D-arabinose 1-dehydrogenase-like Zn-dependent alcohol dehydrogenase